VYAPAYEKFGHSCFRRSNRNLDVVSVFTANCCRIGIQCEHET
jgi:hypothetical protein